MGCRCSDISDCQQDRQGEIQRAEAQAYELKEECREQVQKTLQEHGAEGE